jgi:hypothetical protein
MLFMTGTAAAVIDLSGNWRSSFNGAVIEATLNQRGEAIDGVVYVRNPGGKKDTYHFKGSVSGNTVSLAHHSGHRFAGTVTNNGQIQGVVTTRGGSQVPLQMFRQ